MPRLRRAPCVIRKLWNGVEFDIGTGPPIATIVVRDRWIIPRMLLDPIVTFGDAYSDGRLEVHGDLAAFLEQVFATRSAAPRRSLWRSLAVRLAALAARQQFARLALEYSSPLQYR